MKIEMKKVFAALFSLGLMTSVQAQSPSTATCTISQADFSKWFVGGKIAQNGLVNFANSAGFPKNNTVCDFYKWSDQMFLWITSPLGKTLVLDSAVFYDVNFNSTGAVFIPNGSGANATRSFQLRGAKQERAQAAAVNGSIQPAGQAGGNDTLVTLNGSLVYFGVHANDGFAWFNTAVINNAAGFSAASPFPTTSAEMAKVVAYAGSNGTKIGDGAALTMELKTAWVDAQTLSNPGDYVTISSSVPNYIGKVGDATWTISTTAPTITKTLALVGMHVVGTVQGHPEMVWATVEHRNNAPDNSYFVSFGSSPIQAVPYNSSGSWQFMTNGGSQTGALVPMATIDGTTGNVVATSNKGIVQNNVYRVMPFGSPPTTQFANNNGQLVSLNKNVRGMLAQVKDVRSNYFLVGAVWTRNGSIPSTGTDSTNQVGSLLLANSAMETYHQVDKQGCFGCHFASSSTGTSHLFSTTNTPLPTSK